MQEQDVIHNRATQDDEGIWLIVYDLDLTLTVQHTGGDTVRQAFEKPLWRNNLRSIDTLRRHLQKMKRHCRLAIGTYGWWQERVEAYRDELWLKKDELLIHAEYIDTKKHRRLGKNKHIAHCLLQHYKTPNAPKIFGVLLIDDSQRNIDCLKYYERYIEKKHGNNPLLKVPIESILMPTPICYQQKIDNAASVCEQFYSQATFVDTLKSIERAMLPEHGSILLEDGVDMALEKSSEAADDDEIYLSESDSSSSLSEPDHMTFFRTRLTRSVDCASQSRAESSSETLSSSHRNQLIASK